jgi:hypothetical protein
MNYLSSEQTMSPIPTTGIWDKRGPICHKTRQALTRGITEIRYHDTSVQDDQIATDAAHKASSTRQSFDHCCRRGCN